jgi:hypothetical protein
MRSHWQRFWIAGVFAVFIALSAASANAQPPTGSYVAVQPLTLPLDRDGVWTLNFAYTPPRILTVNTPDRGRQTVWYIVYQVWNTTDTPHTFIPTFELVTKDGKLLTLLDEPEPAITEAIRKIEDPTGALDIKTSISIGKTPIPVTRADSLPRSVYGVAVWPSVSTKAPDVNNFSIYVTGLSNGLAVSERENGTEEVTVKTLQMDFVRPTDSNRQRLNDIRPNDNGGLGAERWIYRPIPLSTKKTVKEPGK